MRNKKYITKYVLSVLFLLIQTGFLKAQNNDTIPVIVHVINLNEGYGSGTNLDSIQIYSQLSALNKDFNGSGFNTSLVPGIWQPLIANTGITFVPALYDPLGNLLTEKGINRVPYTTIPGLASPGSGYNQSTIESIIKPATIWDVNLYCNIWVIKLSSGLNGYSTFPDSTGFSWVLGNIGNSTNDGIVINYKNFGDTLNVYPQYNKGRTLTHEMGHWLGLIHNTDFCATSAYLSDIWPANYNAITSIPLPHIYPLVGTECVGDINGAMFMNFMCQDIDSNLVMFSNMQGDTMLYALHHAKFKHNLQHSWVYKNGNLATNVKLNERNNTFFEVFPNPSNDGYINFKTNVKAIYKIEVLNSSGSTVNFELDKNNTAVKLSVNSGIYLLKIYYEQGVFIKRISIN